MIKIEKRVTTEYIFNEYSKTIKSSDIVEDIQALENAGVDMTNASFELREDKSGFKNVVVTLTNVTYWDESVINRMEK